MLCNYGCSLNAAVGGDPRHGVSKWAGPWRTYVAKVFVLLDGIVICQLYIIMGEAVKFLFLAGLEPTVGGRAFSE